MANNVIASIQTQLDKVAAAHTELDLEKDSYWITAKQQLTRLSQNIQRRELFLEAATAISNTVNSSIEVNTLLNAAINLIKDSANFYYTGVFLLDSAATHVELKADSSLIENSSLHKEYRLPLNNKSTIGRVIDRQQMLMTTNIKPDTPCFRHKNLPDVGSEAVIPLITRSEIIGVLVLQCTDPVAFSREDAHSLQTIGDQLANAIQNVTLFTTTDRQLEQLAVLHNINLQLDRHLELEPLLNEVAKLSARLLNTDAGVVRLTDKENKTLTIQSAFNPPSNIKIGQPEAFGSTSLSREVIDTHQTVLANNWPEYAKTKGYTNKAKKSLAIINAPIAAQGKIIGTIEVHSATNLQAFDENDRYILSLLGSQVGAAIERTRLFTRAENNYRFVKTIIEHIPDPIFIKDRNHTWIEMNQANANVIGKPEEELIGKTDSHFFPPELFEEFYRRDDEVFTTNKILEHEDTTVWDDGKAHVAYTRLIPIPEASGKNPEYLLGITHDVTERKAHEAERERYVAETAALYKGSQSIARALSERQVFDALFEQIRLENPCEITAFRFYMVKDEPIWADVKGSWQKADKPSYITDSRFYLPETPQAHLLTTQKPLFIEDIATDERLSEAERKSFEPTEAVSVAILPVNFIGQELGSIIIYFTSSRAFSETTKRFWLAMVDQARVALSNQQLLQSSVYRVVQMETAAEVARAASSLLDLSDLLNSAVALIGDRFHLYYVGAFLVDEDSDWAELKAGTGEAGRIQLEKKHRLKIGGESMIGWSIEHRQPRIALDVGREAVHFQNPYLPNTRSELALPLIYHNQAIGALTVQSEEPAAFSAEDIVFLQTMADQLANAIENARLFEKAQQEIAERKRAEEDLRINNAELGVLNRVNSSIASMLDLEAILQVTAREIVETLNARNCGIALANADNTELTVVADHSLSPKDPSSKGLVIPLANNPSSSQVIETGQSLIIQNAQTNPLTISIHQVLKERQTQCLMIVPLKVRGEVIGTIGVDTTETSREFTADELRLTETIAAQVAGAVENARLFEQAQATLLERQHAQEELMKALARTESLYRIGDTVSTVTDKKELFNTILGEYLRLLNLDWGVVSLLDKAREFSQFQAMYANGKPVQSKLSIAVSNNPLFQHLLNTPKPLVIEDAYTHPLTKDNKETRRKLKAKSILYTPIVVRGLITGIIAAGSPEKSYHFSQGDIELGQAVSDQLSIWLENRQLLTEAHHRSERLQTAAEVSRAASSILDLDELIDNSVNYIRDQFEFYYVGLFLVDKAKKWAVLRAGTGEAGRIQLKNNHRLEIGGESMIGWSVNNRKARIALDVGKEAVRFKNPILPDTHSEMALPLISRDEVIGALTVQSTERGAFSDEDITLLQTMADQLANAIVNARLFENSTQAQKDAEASLQETIALQQLSQNLAVTLDVNKILNIFFEACVKEIGFEYVQFSLVDKYQNRVKTIAGIGISESNIKRANHSLDSKDIMADIIKTGQTEVITGWDERFDKEIFEAEGHADWVRIFTPVTLRQENIGLVEAGFNKNVHAQIESSQIRLLSAFINQTALALDNANRYEASQRAARREALIKEITTKVRASTDLDTILKTTVQEVGNAISSTRAYIHLTPQKSNGKEKTKSGVEIKR